MKNYYKILQVDKDASPEVIKVAYKLLVKKYHPDLKEGEEKKQAEEKIKVINDAYDILSDSTKRAEFDKTLINDTITPEQYNLIINENINLKKELTYFRNLYNKDIYSQPQHTNMYSNYNMNTNDSSNNNVNKTIFNTDLIKNFITEKIKTFIAIVITLLFLFILFNLPFIKSLIPEFLNSNYLFIIVFVLVGYIYFFRNKQ